MINMVIELKSNEKKYLQFIIREDNDEYFDITDMVATIQVQKYGQSTLSLNEGCTVTDSVNGTCRWLYNGSLPVGEYTAEIEMTTTTGLKYITPSFDIEVINSLPS